MSKSNISLYLYCSVKDNTIDPCWDPDIGFVNNINNSPFFDAFKLFKNFFDSIPLESYKDSSFFLKNFSLDFPFKFIFFLI